jgi:hypothetical protein
MITGSVASSLQGEPRSTHDIDIVVAIKPSSIDELMRAFPEPEFYLEPTTILDAIKYQSMFNLIHVTEGDKVDFWILTDEPFDLSRFQRRRAETVYGEEVIVSSPEDTILVKLRWAKLSSGSEKQFSDALGVYEVQYPKLDLDYLEHWADRLDVRELWEELRKKANI